MKARTQLTRGFTIVEVIVVITIAVLMLSVVLMAIADARRDARDRQRVSDLANIEFALTLYKDANRAYPDFDTGTEIGLGNTIDTTITQLNGNTYVDPKSTGAGGDYGYYFDSDFNCSGQHQVVVYAKTMEAQKSANFGEVCTYSDPDMTVAGTSTFIVILD